jgi:hypothetical protein
MTSVFGLRGMAAARTCLLVSTVIWLVFAQAAKAAPVLGTPGPAITGTLQVGQPLAVSTGNWTDTLPITYSYAWTSGGVAVGTNSASYTIASTDVGKVISVTVSATDSTPITVAAAPVSTAAVPAPPANTGAPTIGGISQVGRPLTANPGTWTGTAPIIYSYAWTSGGLPVGTNSATYTPTISDVGRPIAVAVSAAGPGGTAGPVPSAPTTAVLPLAPGEAAAPTISGSPQEGQTLTLAQGAWSNGPTAITDQWQDCLGAACIPIPGATGTSHTLGAGDVGYTVQVLETAANAAGPGIPAVSGRTGTVTATSTTSLLVYSASTPLANQTMTLVATVVSGSGNANPAGSLSFFNGQSTVKGCANLGVKGGQSSTVVCQVAFGAGTSAISAVYSPNQGSLVDGSRSGPTTVTVGKDSTSVSLAVTAKVARGKRATYSATVVLPVSNSGPAAPTGQIAFLDRGQTIPACAGQPLTNLTATCTVTYGSRGTHEISALYSGDANFAGSTSTASAVKIVTKAPTVLAFVKSTLGWTFFYHPTYTAVIQLKAFQILKGTTIVEHCYGRSCPFAKRVITVSRAGSVNLLPGFHHDHLRAGTLITVRLTHRHWVGKYYSFRIRAGRPPLIGQSCLAAGGSTPGVGC